MNSSTLVLAGYVCGDPKIETTSSGKTVINFTLSVYAKFRKTKEDQKKKYVSFFDIQYWPNDKIEGNIQSEINKIQKGAILAFNAEPIQERWEHEGKKYSQIKFIVEGFVSALHHRNSSKTTEAESADDKTAPWERK